MATAATAIATATARTKAIATAMATSSQIQDNRHGLGLDHINSRSQHATKQQPKVPATTAFGRKGRKETCRKGRGDDIITKEHSNKKY